MIGWLQCIVLKNILSFKLPRKIKNHMVLVFEANSVKWKSSEKDKEISEIKVCLRPWRKRKKCSSVIYLA